MNDITYIDYDNKDVDKFLASVQGELKKSELVYVKLSSKMFPRRVLDLPEKVRRLFASNPVVKPLWEDVKFSLNDNCTIVNSNSMEKVVGKLGNVYLSGFDSECVTVCIITHNRTNVACATIENLIRNLKYTKLKWCISDDRSDPGHIENLIHTFNENGIFNVKVCCTNPFSYGLGASLNNALQYSWTNGDLSFIVEDDWIL